MIQPGVYQHYKGNRYHVIGTATHTETAEEFVVYKAQYGDGQLWVRPYAMFKEMVRIDGTEVARFTFINESPDVSVTL